VATGGAILALLRAALARLRTRSLLPRSCPPRESGPAAEASILLMPRSGDSVAELRAGVRRRSLSDALP
jgi:hypothetical protein